VDVCYHHVPVVIVGTGAGLSYASLGGTHHSCEEMGMLRLLPNLAVMAPADAHEVNAALKAALQYPHPVYLRIGKKGEPLVHGSEPAIHIGRAINMRDGSDVCLLSTGTVLAETIAAAELLSLMGISAQVASIHTVKPLDLNLLSKAAANFKFIATIEEHSILGGLGGAVAEWLAEQPSPRARLLRFGTRDEFLHETCEQEQAREHFGLTGPAIAKRITEVWNKPTQQDAN
jgi:transketolase